MSEKLSDKLSDKERQKTREELSGVVKDAVVQMGRMSFNTVTLLALGAAEVIAGTGLIMGKAAQLDGPISLDDQVRIALGMDPGMVEPGLRDILVLAGHRAGAIAYDACTEFVKETHAEGKGYDKYLDRLENDMKDFGYSVKLITSLVRKSDAIRRAGASVQAFATRLRDKGRETFSEENIGKTRAMLENTGERFARILRVSSGKGISGLKKGLEKGKERLEEQASAWGDRVKKGMGVSRFKEIFAPFTREELDFISDKETNPYPGESSLRESASSRLARTVEDAGFIIAGAFQPPQREKEIATEEWSGVSELGI